VLSFQRLDVYRCAIEFLALAIDLTTRLPKGYAALADQLRRAALSGPLNIAEAAGRPSETDAARHYGIARGSAMECAAIIDGLSLLSVLTDAENRKAVELLARRVAMLTKLCR
jgi:four helix bundle protein